MPNIKSAKKSLRQSEKRRVINLRKKRNIKKVLKDIKKLLDTQKGKEAFKLVPKAYKAIDKAVKGGVLKKNTASRKKSRLAKMIHPYTKNGN